MFIRYNQFQFKVPESSGYASREEQINMYPLIFDAIARLTDYVVAVAQTSQGAILLPFVYGSVYDHEHGYMVTIIKGSDKKMKHKFLNDKSQAKIEEKPDTTNTMEFLQDESLKRNKMLKASTFTIRCVGNGVVLALNFNPGMRSVYAFANEMQYTDMHATTKPGFDVDDFGPRKVTVMLMMADVVLNETKTGKKVTEFKKAMRYNNRHVKHLPDTDLDALVVYGNAGWFERDFETEYTDDFEEEEEEDTYSDDDFDDYDDSKEEYTRNPFPVRGGEGGGGDVEGGDNYEIEEDLVEEDDNYEDDEFVEDEKDDEIDEDLVEGEDNYEEDDDYEDDDDDDDIDEEKDLVDAEDNYEIDDYEIDDYEDDEIAEEPIGSASASAGGAGGKGSSMMAMVMMALVTVAASMVPRR